MAERTAGPVIAHIKNSLFYAYIPGSSNIVKTPLLYQAISEKDNVTDGQDIRDNHGIFL